MIALLDKLKRELGIAFIFIAHDLPVVKDFADHVMVMEKGRSSRSARSARSSRRPVQAYTRRLLAAGLDPDPEVQKARRLILQPVA